MGRIPLHAVLHARLDVAVRRVMRPGVVSIADGASLRQVERAMLSHGVHALLVVGEDDGRTRGWITSRGLLRWLAEDDSLPAAGAVDMPAITMDPGAPAQRASLTR
jgi:CBS domain-containing protein